MSTVHESVLLNETILGLDLDEKQKALVIDGTFGGGGHSYAVLAKYPLVNIIALDQDAGAWDRAREKFKDFLDRIEFRNQNFREIAHLDVVPKAIMLDLGLSSDQLDMVGRGFSFRKNEPLLMTMEANPKEDTLTAYDIVNTWSMESIEAILRGYAEEKFAKRIAGGIVTAREIAPIENTFDLVAVIEDSVPGFYKRGKIHPATRTFQALRMAVNDEINTLKQGLVGGFELLAPKGRFAVISFHSGEDRIVKNFFKEKVQNGEAILINKKPIIPTREELQVNKRSRSAKLRVIEKI
ncbi:MAG: 16S rRNA (cytosine(1402)-N(4))-methyltransferase RsmH [Candidatus Paceibacteria bacterium]